MKSFACVSVIFFCVSLFFCLFQHASMCFALFFLCVCLKAFPLFPVQLLVFLFVSKFLAMFLYCICVFLCLKVIPLFPVQLVVFLLVFVCFSICSSYLHVQILLFLVSQKLNFFVGFPHQYKTFFCYITCTFKRTRLRLFRLKISQCIPFRIKNLQNLSKTCKKGTNCEI